LKDLVSLFALCNVVHKCCLLALAQGGVAWNKSHPLTAPLHYYKEADGKLGETTKVQTTEARFQKE
jgi:hypothetical protein